MKNKTTTKEEKYKILLNAQYPCEPIDLGNVIAVCHVGNQVTHITHMLPAIKPFVKDIILIDDCSTDGTAIVAKDFGCKMVYLPNGWIYTHGFSKLWELGLSTARKAGGDFFLQVDADERLYVPGNQQPFSKNNNWYGIYSYFDHPGIGITETHHLTRIVNLYPSIAPVMQGIIHQGPVNPQKHVDSKISLLHLRNRYPSVAYEISRNRLYAKLMQKGYKTHQLNDYWMGDWEKNKHVYITWINDGDKQFGELTETKDPIIYGEGWESMDKNVPLGNRYAELLDLHLGIQDNPQEFKQFSGEIVWPRQLEIHLPNYTNVACNLTCEHCQGQNLNRAMNPYDDVMLPLLNKLEGRIPLFVISGAYCEPTLNPRVIEYIRAIKKQGASFGLHTNGTLLTAMEKKSGFVSEMVSLCDERDYITCALDAGTPDSYARLKKCSPRLFNKAIDGLRLVREKALSYGDNRVSMRITYLLNDFNHSVKELANIKGLANYAGANTLRLAVPYALYGTSIEECREYKKDFELPFAEKVWPNVEQIESVSEGDPGTYVFGMKVTAQDVDRLWYNHCYYGYFQITIGADGYFYRCSSVAAPDFEALQIGKATSSLEEFKKIILRNQSESFDPHEPCFQHGATCNRVSLDINTIYDRRYYGKD